MHVMEDYFEIKYILLSEMRFFIVAIRRNFNFRSCICDYCNQHALKFNQIFKTFKN